MSLPPAQPAYIFRGHSAPVHFVTFIRSNTRLVTGDAEGWIIVWSLETRRPTAVWHAHEGSILGVGEWEDNTLATHGKDNKIVVWSFTKDDEASLSVAPPIDQAGVPRNLPPSVNSFNVNSLNFCSFSHCEARAIFKVPDTEPPPPGSYKARIFAVPNAINPEAVDIMHHPSCWRWSTVTLDKSTKVGMVMAVSMFWMKDHLTLAVGYESGHAAVIRHDTGDVWQALYLSKPHDQPVLSLDVSLSLGVFFTSSADAIIAKHPIPTIEERTKDDTPLSSTAIINSVPGVRKGISGLSAQFAALGESSQQPIQKITIQETPIQISPTKHAGQQGLKVRSDSKIFATAGWDSRVRVYSMQRMKELAVLKWHKEGCYTLAFAEIGVTEGDAEAKPYPETQLNEDGNTGASLVASRGTTLSVKEKRLLKAASAHWLAVGSKDGKVSLWEIY